MILPKECEDSHLMKEAGNNKYMYPTKEEIFKTPIKINKKILKIMEEWKTFVFDNPKNKTNDKKFFEIFSLLTLIKMKCNKPFAVILGEAYKYNPTSKTITLDHKHPSIISALHELGHHFYGNSELKACRFSIGLFKTCFPEAYEKLKWKGHLLVKPN